MNLISRWLLCVFAVFIISAGYSNNSPFSKQAKMFGITSKKTASEDLKPVARQVFEARSSRNQFIVQKPLTVIHTNESFRSGVRQSSILQLTGGVLESMLQSKHEFIELQLDDANGKTWSIDLYRTQSVSNDFAVITADSGGEPVFIDGAIFYRGVVKGDYNSVAAFSIFEGNILGMISSDHGNMVLHPLESEEGSFIFYNDRDLQAEMPFSCGMDDLEWKGPEHNEEDGVGSRALSDCVRVYIECDFALYQNKGSNVTNVVNWITAVFNNVATLYANESINTAISEVFVWNTSDPYSKTNASTALNQFRNLRTNFNGDLAHLAALGGNNLGGVAWLNSLCTTYKYAYSNISSNYQNVPTYSWTVMVMTHEMGHNLSSNHTQWCGWVGGALDNCYTTEGSCGPGPAPVGGGTIMSYCHLTSNGINFNNGFGIQPGNKIRSRVSAVNCLSPSCTGSGGGGGTCGIPTGLSSSNITSTTATVTWNAVNGATSYIFQYKLATSSIWSQTTISGTTANFTSLTPSTSYNCRVRAVCAGGNSDFSNILTFTTLGAATCNTPGGLSTANVSSNSASVSWNAVAGAVSYNLQYKLASASVWTEVNTASTSMVLNSLASNTIYNWRVQAVCSFGSSSLSSFLTFTTLSATTCNAPTGLQSSGVTSNSVNLSWSAVNGATSYVVEYKLASGSIWSQQNSATNNISLSGLSANSVYNWRVSTVCGQNSSVQSPTFNFTTLQTQTCNAPTGLNASNISSTSAQLSWSAVNGATGYIVEYKLSSASIWSQENTSSNNVTISPLASNSAYDWRVQSICSSGPGAISTTQGFTTLPAPSCNAPSGLNVSNITSTSVDLSWNSVSGAVSYILEYKLTSAGNWTQTTPSGTSTTLTGLQPNSAYNWRVQSICSGNSSAFSSGPGFTTPQSGACNTPTNLNSENVTSSTATLSWSAVSGAISYNVEYKHFSDNNWTAANTSANFLHITGLIASSQYQWRVQSVCNGNTSQFSFISSFRTSLGGGTCGTPVNVSASNITSSSASVSWGAVSGAVSYNVQYKLSSDGTWNSINVTGTTTILSSLLANSTYNVRIQAICSGSSGAFSNVINFTTLNTGPACNAPSGLNVSNITENSASVSWNSVSGAISYNVEYKLASSGNWSQSNVSGTSMNLTALIANSAYNVRVQTVCNSGNSAFSATLNFTTLNTSSPCNVPSGLNVSNITANQAQISWSAVSGAVSYTLEYKLASAQTWIPVNVSNTTHLLNSLLPNSTYNYRVRTVCASGFSAFSATSSFTTQQDQGGSGYCSSSGQNASIEWISRVAISSINRVSGSDGGYFDATSMSADVPRSRSQTLIHKAGFSGAARTIYWRMWIDLNQDGDFNDPGELLVSVSSSSTNDLYSTFVIPTNAMLGPTRMRVQAKYNAYGDPCETFANGEVEDYTIVITNLFGLPASEGNEESEAISQVKLYPNPVAEELNISFLSDIYTDVSIQIVDLYGRMIKEEEYYARIGDNRMAVTVSDLLSGAYVLILKNGNMIKNYRFIKAK